MTQISGEGLTFLAIALLICLVVAIQLIRGVTFGSFPSIRFIREIDPFGFWLGIAAESAIAIFLGAWGLALVRHIGSSN